MSPDLLHADFAHNIFRQPIVYPYQSQSGSRSISRTLRFLISTICLPCFEHVFRVYIYGSADAWKNARKCAGPFHKAHLCIRPSMAIFRLHLKGARLKWHSASASDILSLDKNLSWKESNGANTVLHAWYIAAVRYSRYEIS